MHQQPKHIDGECMLGVGGEKKHLQNNGHALIEDRYKKKQHCGSICPHIKLLQNSMLKRPNSWRWTKGLVA